MSKETKNEGYLKYPEQKSPDWFRSLRVKLTLYHIFFLIALVVSTILALFYIEDKLLIEQGHAYTQQLGNRIVAELGQRITMTEAMTKSLARLGENLEKKDEIFKRVIPQVLDFQGDDRIAGGGIWPEPYAYDPKLQRKSFFWGRQENSKLQFFDDYNNIEGPGYHHEEWYVPARYLNRERVYWSKSYMDPYSYEPMVTCTAPMFVKGKFSGVSTIDLKLTGLDTFFSKKAEAVDGYIFALDRNNKLLSFPDLTIAKSYTTDNKGKISEEFLSLEELATKKKSYSELNSQLKSINNSLKSTLKNNKFKLQSELIAQNSYQIELKEAELIAATLNVNPEAIEQRIFNKDDPILNKSVMYSIFLVPETGWKIIVAVPKETVNAFATKVTYSILYVIIILELIILLAMLWIISRSVTSPLKVMCDQLRQSPNIETGEDIKLNENRNDELGVLSYEINKRSHLIKNAIDKLKDSNTGLEKRVHDRTAEIERALKQLEEAKENAESANNSKSLFLANMSHEIRTPMNAILGYADILDKTIVDPKLKGHLSTIKASGETLLNLINDILDLSKVEAGKIDLNFEIVNPKIIFKNIYRQFYESAQAKGITLNLTINADLPDAVLIDEHRMNQILTNIVSNAIKFTNTGSVTIKVESYNRNISQLIFSIIDTGVGIPEGEIDNIFENFVQIEQLNSSHFSGTGLGLAITRKLTHLMDGEINVKSTFGQGTTFQVILSNVEPVASPREMNRSLNEKYIFDKATLLIVDDIPINRELLVHYFEDYPFVIYQASNGQEALDKCNTNNFDLVLMDMKMPIMDGYTATKLIKEKNKNIPVIAVTASALKTSEQEIRNLCEGYLRKPINEKDLLQELAKYIKHRKEKISVLDKTVIKNHSKKILSLLNDLTSEITEAAENLEITQLSLLVDKLDKINADYSCDVFNQWLCKLKEEFNSFNMQGLAGHLNEVQKIKLELEKLAEKD
jgi:signal transduction histidine kinase/DNA-binding response OmpR family regulator